MPILTKHEDCRAGTGFLSPTVSSHRSIHWVQRPGWLTICWTSDPPMRNDPSWIHLSQDRMAQVSSGQSSRKARWTARYLAVLMSRMLLRRRKPRALTQSPRLQLQRRCETMTKCWKLAWDMLIETLTSKRVHSHRSVAFCTMCHDNVFSTKSYSPSSWLVVASLVSSSTVLQHTQNIPTTW